MAAWRRERSGAQHRGGWPAQRRRASITLARRAAHVPYDVRDQSNRQQYFNRGQ
ncbi:unnamed protein product [Mycetohabitans rhizoxinica HKI 454]|uniref:Uncharacterized protein n=1 Tax=Mycetohabitans rhizoxinica (strain DSM 19002 / CIP 109453 / HKI 454) TaxID=882378 RepID=E5AQ21_MYCRK|nr:unnamed protein product [Mycetohabitans rhizoxinica HKI 454]